MSEIELMKKEFEMSILYGKISRDITSLDPVTEAKGMYARKIYTDEYNRLRGEVDEARRGLQA